MGLHDNDVKANIVTMTNWMPDLSSSSQPRYIALADAIAGDIVKGTLRVGTRLPTHRDLAYRLGVTVGTVSRGYAEASRRGLIGGEVGRGTFVLEQSERVASEPSGNAGWGHGGGSLTAVAASAGAGDVASGGSDMLPADWFASHGDQTDLIDLAPNYPLMDNMGGLLSELFARVGSPQNLLPLASYQHPAGRTGHREIAAEWLSTLGIEASPDEVLITPGCQGGLTATMSALTRPGDTVLAEALTWPGVDAFGWNRGVRVRGVPLDEYGPVPEALDALCGQLKPRLLYLMPTMHNPTTTVMPVQRREQVAEIARRHDLVIVEDHVYSFVVTDPPPPMRAFAPERTIAITSMSKCLAPALRVGFLNGPRALLPTICAALRATVMMTSSLTVEVAAEAIRSGDATRAADFQRETARRRQSLAASILGNARMRRHPSSFHLWLEVPMPWRVHDFVAEAQLRGVAVTSGEAFRIHTPGPMAEPVAGAPPFNAVRVCLNAAADEDQLVRGLGIIADLIGASAATSLPVI